MARAVKAVVQSERLSDQVYELMLEDLQTGQFGSGQRLVEVELADKYRVSRSPVREALIQLSRDGLVVNNERGFATPTFSRSYILHRIAVKRLLEPRVAEHAAIEANEQDLKKLAKALEREKAMHAADKAKEFNAANQEFRKTYRAICRNELLVRCLNLVDNQFETVRYKIHMIRENREESMRQDRKLFEALSARDPKRAAGVVFDSLAFLEIYYSKHPPAEFG